MFIFEDKDDSPISYLLKQGTTLSCEFRNTNREVFRRVQTLAKDDLAVCFINVNPRNSETEVLFRKLLLAARDLSNVFIIPIIGIEEIALKFFQGITDLDSLFDFSSVDLKVNSYLLDENISFEKMLKLLYNKCTGSYYCLKNRSMLKHPGGGSFFKGDCSNSCLARTQEPDLACPLSKMRNFTLQDKGLMFWRCMPIREKDSNCLPFGDVTLLAEHITQERRLVYINLCEHFDLAVPDWVNTFTVYPFSLMQCRGGKINV